MSTNADRHTADTTDPYYIESVPMFREQLDKENDDTIGDQFFDSNSLLFILLVIFCVDDQSAKTPPHAAQPSEPSENTRSRRSFDRAPTLKQYFNFKTILHMKKYNINC